jgi:hypothetical protein
MKPERANPHAEEKYYHMRMSTPTLVHALTHESMIRWVEGAARRPAADMSPGWCVRACVCVCGQERAGGTLQGNMIEGNGLAGLSVNGDARAAAHHNTIQDGEQVPGPARLCFEPRLGARARVVCVPTARVGDAEGRVCMAVRACAFVSV